MMNNRKDHAHVNPWWAALTVWGVVNAVNVLQAAGFLSRVITRTRTIDHILGYAIIALAFPSTAALVAFIPTRVSWQHWIGPGSVLGFIALMIIVEYVWVVEFQSPMQYDILVPYLVLFFGSILLMGLPMLHMDRRRWFATAVTTILLLGAMEAALCPGMG